MLATTSTTADEDGRHPRCLAAAAGSAWHFRTNDIGGNW